MFKYSKLILIMLICLVIISIGYALLSGNVTFTSSAKLNPTKLDLQLEYGVVPYGDPSFSLSTTQTGHSNESISCSDTTCSYNVSFDTPGARQDFYVQITNNSVFDVRIKQVNVKTNYSGERSGEGTTVVGIYSKKKSELTSSSDRITVLPVSSSLNTDNVEISGDEICKTSSCYLKKDGGVYTFGISESAVGDDNTNVLKYNLSRTFEFIFEQVN